MALAESAFLAWKGWLSRPSRVKLHPDDVSALLAYFKDSNTSMEEAPLSCGEDDTNFFEEYWAETLKSAGRKSGVSRVTLLAWHASFGATGAVAQSNKTVQALHALLVKLGVSDALDAALEAEEIFKRGARDCEEEESTGAHCAWAIYTGEWLVDEKALLQLQSLQHASKSVPVQGNSQYVTCNIMSVTRYYDVHKHGTCNTLSQALTDKTGRKWLAHTLAVTRILTAHGLTGAAARWMRFVAYSQQQFPFDTRSQLCYVRHFFFEECTGLGLPTDMGAQSVEAARRASSDSVAAQAMEAAFIASCPQVGPWSLSQPQSQASVLGSMPPSVGVQPHMVDGGVAAAVASELARLGLKAADSTAPPIVEIDCPVCGLPHSAESCTWVQQAKAVKKAAKVKSDAEQAAKRRAAAAATKVDGAAPAGAAPGS